MDKQHHQAKELGAATAASKVAARLRIAAGVFVGLAIAAWIFRGFLWQVVEALMLNVVPILFTPIILELSIGFFGLFIVLLFSHLRRREQEDEWVYISRVEPEAEMEEIPEPLRKRVGEMVLRSKPIDLGRDELPLQAVEGLIELGMYEEAGKELSKGDSIDRRRRAHVRLSLLVFLQQEKWGEAEDYLAARPASREDLAVFCVEAARHFIKLKPAKTEQATRCLEMGKALSVNAVVNAIDADGRLQKLA